VGLECLNGWLAVPSFQKEPDSFPIPFPFPFPNRHAGNGNGNGIGIDSNPDGGMDDVSCHPKKVSFDPASD